MKGVLGVGGEGGGGKGKGSRRKGVQWREMEEGEVGGDVGGVRSMKYQQ